jgi:S-adenosylmethionine hydrolase
MIITLLTDFGDFYPGVMKGVIYSLAPEARIVDITHSIEPQNVFQGAFLLYHSYRYFRNAIHVAVVDPGVGGKRRAIAVKTRNHYFVGPDNGILYPSAA